MSAAAALIARLVTQKRSSWRPELLRAFPDDPALVRECLARLTSARARADHGGNGQPPRLGARADARFDLIRCLDVGATAEVWMARDARLGRVVAIKVFRHEASNLQQALAEAKRTADVVSEHAVRVLDVADDDCRPHIVMELVAERRSDDPSLDSLEIGTSAATAEGRPRSIAEAVRWVIDVARGVQVAHARDVFHRDIKPQNVMITPVHRKARITDFGLGIGLAAGGGSQLIVASSDGGPVSICGTPEYMAPEQARGLPVVLDTRESSADRKTLVAVDVWGLGALLYQLLCGRAPWVATDTDEAWEVARDGRPAELPQRFAGERIPQRLRRVIAKAMALDPSERYMSPAAFAADLEAVLRNEPTSFDTGALIQFLLRIRRNPYPAVAAFSAVATVALLLVGYIGVRALEAQRATLEVRLGEKANALRELESDLKQNKSELEQNKRTLNDTRTLIETERTNAGAALRDALKKIDILRGTLGAVEGKLRNTVAARDRAIADGVEQSARADESANALAREQDGHRKTTTALRNEVEAHSKTRGERDTARSERETLMSTIAREQDEHRKTTMALSNEVEAHAKTRGERDTARSERETLKNQLDTAISEREAAKRRSEELEKELSTRSAPQPAPQSDN